MENKLFEFDNRLKNLDIMLGLLESKLNSLPQEITNGYPELMHISLNDINPEIAKINSSSNNNVNNTNMNKTISSPGNNRSNSGVEVAAAEAPKEEVAEVNKELTANEKLLKFIEENEDITTYYNMLK